MILRFPVPDDPWSVNEIPSSVKAKIKQSKQKQAWRDTSTLIARSEMAKLGIRRVEGQQLLMSSNVQVTIPFRMNRRRDPHNYVGTVVKAVVDGLVRAGLWPDDNPEFVTVLEPLLVVGTEVVVSITPRGARVMA